MNIAVLIKQVPDVESRVTIASDGAHLDTSQASWIINPFDEIALEQAVQLKEERGGEVIVITAGPASAEKVLRDAFVVGADRGIRVDTGDAELDAVGAAQALTAALKDEGCDLVLAGKKSIDEEAGLVHIAVAEYLGVPHVSPVEKCSLSDDGSTIRVTRAATGSTKEIIDVDLPAVMGCEKGLCEPRYPTLQGKMQARSKSVDIRPLGDAGAPVMKVRAYEPVPQRGTVTMIGGSPEEAAKELVHVLEKEGVL